MSEAADKRWDDRLKTAGVVLGLLSTALTLFVAAKTQVIAATTQGIDVAVEATKKQAAAIERQLREQDLQLKSQDLSTKTWDTSARIVADWDVMPAAAFAKSLDEQGTKFVFPDDTLEGQLRTEAVTWAERGSLMGRAQDNGLLLRQIVCLRLLNVGSGPADKIRMIVRKLDFDLARHGEQGASFSELARRKDSLELTLSVPKLMNVDKEVHRLATVAVIPVAQLVGKDRYVGRVFLPSEVYWFDERQKTERKLVVDLGDPEIRYRLIGAELGRTRGG